MAQAANQLSKGEHNISIKELNRHDEIGILSNAFKRMVRNIRESKIGHDLNGIKQELDSLMEEDIPEAFHFIVSSTNKMDLLLNALLRLSRISRENLNIQTLDMNLKKFPFRKQ